MNKRLTLALLTARLGLVVLGVCGIGLPTTPGLENARGLAAQGEFEAAIGALEEVLRKFPNDDEAKLLRAEWQEDLRASSEEAQRQTVLAKREQRPREYFQQWMSRTPNSELFSQQEMKVRGTSGNVEAKLLQSLTNNHPIFKLQTLAIPDAESFSIRAIQDMGVNGWRRLDLVGGETANGEVTLIFKVFEYSYRAQFHLPGTPGEVEEQNMIPIHPSRISKNESFLLRRRTEGVGLIRLRILGVVHAAGFPKADGFIRQ